MAFVELSIVPSSNVAAVQYSNTDQTLRVVFVRGGRIYEFYGVDQKTADEFSGSGLSAGRVFLESIKNRFPYEEIS